MNPINFTCFLSLCLNVPLANVRLHVGLALGLVVSFYWMVLL